MRGSTLNPYAPPNSLANHLPNKVDYRIEETAIGTWRLFTYKNGRSFQEFTTHVKLGGVPIYHFTSGRCPETGRSKVAFGVIAIGRFAVGLVAIGQLSLGVIGIGQATLGLAAGFGQLALGSLAFGQLAIAPLFAFGQFAIAYQAVGQLAAGIVVSGGLTYPLLP